MVMLGHSCDITPLLMSLASSKSFDVSMTKGVVIVGVVVSDSTDPSSLAVAMGNFAVDLVVSPRVA